MKRYTVTAFAAVAVGGFLGAFMKKSGCSWKQRVAVAVPYGIACGVAGYMAWKADETEVLKSINVYPTFPADGTSYVSPEILRFMGIDPILPAAPWMK